MKGVKKHENKMQNEGEGELNGFPRLWQEDGAEIEFEETDANGITTVIINLGTGQDYTGQQQQFLSGSSQILSWEEILDDCQSLPEGGTFEDLMHAIAGGKHDIDLADFSRLHLYCY